MCSVCGHLVEASLHAVCDECMQPFHLNLRIDRDEASCGAAYVGASCGMSVYCEPCGARLEGQTAAAGGRLARVGQGGAMSQGMTCWVCTETEIDVRLISSCDGCGQDYHLNPYQTPGKDCGDASLDELDEPTLMFFCRPCMDGTTAELIEARAAGS